MKTYTLSKYDITMLDEALNLFESTLIERHQFPSIGPAEKKMLENRLEHLGLLSLYLHKKSEE
jgi:hypothetical protein